MPQTAMRADEMTTPDGSPESASVRENVAATTTTGLEMESPRSTTVLERGVTVKGQISSREDLTIEGEVEGTIEMREHRLTVGSNGNVHANVRPREVVVIGSVHGDVEATENVYLCKDAIVVGDIQTAAILIEDGGFIKGSIDISRRALVQTQADGEIG